VPRPGAGAFPAARSRAGPPVNAALRHAAACLLLPLCAAAGAVQDYEVRVLERKPQSREHFVQGLEIVDDKLYVSTGTYGGSGLYRYDFDDMRPQGARRLDRRIFAEGVTVLGERIYQLTWRNGRILVYDRDSLRPRGGMPLRGEGWGLTNDGRRLVVSDGSAQLHFLAAEDGRHLHSVEVREDGRPLRLLNELEWVDGQVWANVWRSDRIVIIDPDSGQVTASIDLSGLLPAAERRSDTDVLNGIARDPASGAIWVTGKRWPWLYRIELLEVGEKPPLPAQSR